MTVCVSGGIETQYPGEDRVRLKSPAVATYDMQPEMGAYEVTDKVVEAVWSKKYDASIVIHANCDMVGHTGVMEAATRAVEVVDECLARVVPALLAMDYQVLITAGHGNAEEMIDYETGLVKTSHTTFPVECIYVANEPVARLVDKKGKLSDLAPSLLHLMELAVPKEMTADDLFK